jgi:hypothetical protein
MNNLDDERSSEPDPVEQMTNQALDASIDDLSPDVRRKLNQIRINAVSKKQSRFVLVPLASSLALALAILVGTQFNSETNIVEETPFAEVLQEDLELLDELEFVYWMSEEGTSAKL